MARVPEQAEISAWRKQYRAKVIARTKAVQAPFDAPNARPYFPTLTQWQKFKKAISDQWTRFQDWLFNKPPKPVVNPEVALAIDSMHQQRHGLVRAIGFDACRARKPKETNPYPDGTDEFYLWLIGYEQGRSRSLGC